MRLGRRYFSTISIVMVFRTSICELIALPEGPASDMVTGISLLNEDFCRQGRVLPVRGRHPDENGNHACQRPDAEPHVLPVYATLLRWNCKWRAADCRLVP
jgi:hypothetical protein